MKIPHDPWQVAGEGRQGFEMPGTSEGEGDEAPGAILVRVARLRT
jgi:hypothetical protein